MTKKTSFLQIVFITFFTFLLYYLSLNSFIVQAQNASQRFPILHNMVHHNPGEPRFNTKYTEPNYIKNLDYTGQAPKFEIQCAVTYDDYELNLVPQRTAERLWIDRKATDIKRQLNKALEAGMTFYPFTDVLVVPKSVMEKYGDEMKINGKLSILILVMLRYHGIQRTLNLTQ